MTVEKPDARAEGFRVAIHGVDLLLHRDLAN